MEQITIDWDLLDTFSYRTNLGKSLKNTLRKFNKVLLLEEISEVISAMDSHADAITHDHRVKALQSCYLKYNKYYPSTPVEKAFNDLLGIRIIVSDYTLVDQMILPDNVKIADMRHGKAQDDGYRAIHMYYQKDHFCYPIEIQFMTATDELFNKWLHIYLYKYISDSSIGQKLKTLYDKGLIVSKNDFEKEMQKLCVI